jgi:hypothetical protein
MNIKIAYIFICSLFVANSIFAQEYASKVPFEAGKKIKMTSIDSSTIEQKRGEDNMEMKTISNSVSEILFVSGNEKEIKVTNTLNKIKVFFEGYGQKMEFDSEDPKKQEGMMAEQIKTKLGKADTLNITTLGKTIESKDKDTKGKEKGRGMMRMMSQGGGNIENAFLLIPKEAKEGNGWKVDGSKDDLKIQTIYFLDKLNGNIAKVTFKRKTKGTITTNGNGMEMKIEVDNLSNGELIVDVITGLVKSYNETTNSNSKMNMMGQDMPSTGVISTHVIFE